MQNSAKRKIQLQKNKGAHISVETYPCTQMCMNIQTDDPFVFPLLLTPTPISLIPTPPLRQTPKPYP